jgi:hypothetical protein
MKLRSSKLFQLQKLELTLQRNVFSVLEVNNSGVVETEDIASLYTSASTILSILILMKKIIGVNQHLLFQYR